MLDLKRQRLLARQEALLAALVADGPAVPGLDPHRVALAGRGLALKRHHEALHSWPGLERRVGPSIHGLFEQYAATHRRPPGGAPTIDGYRFACWLAAQGEPAAQTVVAHFREGKLGVEPRPVWARWGMQGYYWLSVRARFSQAGFVGKLLGPTG